MLATKNTWADHAHTVTADCDTPATHAAVGAMYCTPQYADRKQNKPKRRL